MKKQSKNVIWWCLWFVFALALAAYFSWQLFLKKEKTAFLIGEASHGHFQIEMACETCHTSPFGGKDILQEACENCHAEDLELAHDSHPKKKFTDPRNADSIKILDARYCISCHTEHQMEQTRAMGVTLPDDYCFHCHVDIGEERESHKDLAFDSCASAGCHNFHDNRALYESFLVENANQDWIKTIVALPLVNATSIKNTETKPALTLDEAVAPSAHMNEDILHDWEMSAHAQAGINCEGCHSTSQSQSNKVHQNNKKTNDIWIEKPGIETCKQCHQQEVATFKQGKHGMRLADEVSHPLSAVKPADSPSSASLQFHENALQKHQSCTACHSAHRFDREFAAVDACLGCHDDEHSQAFEASPHGQIWQHAIATNADTGGLVSCASCHMPRGIEKSGGETIVSVNHNQNFNLRPNEKMLRSVCMNCHGLGFAINALADEGLIRNNFSGKPSVDIPSIEWALKRENR